MYNIILTNSAIKDIERLDIITKNRIGKKLKLFSKNPIRLC